MERTLLATHRCRYVWALRNSRKWRIYGTTTAVMLMPDEIQYSSSTSLALCRYITFVTLVLVKLEKLSETLYTDAIMRLLISRYNWASGVAA